MSLLEDVKAHYETQTFPPDGEDLDYVKNSEGDWVKSDTETEKVSEEATGDYARWGTWTEWVYRRGDEYVAVKDCAPATEYQNWGDYGTPEIYLVTPVTETVVVTKYAKAT